MLIGGEAVLEVGTQGMGVKASPVAWIDFPPVRSPLVIGIEFLFKRTS